MTAQNLTIRFPAPFPSTVAGDGGIAVSKENGVWIIEPDFSALGAILPAALADPTAKQIWVFDPVTEIYNVLTLGGLGEALYKATSTTSLAIGAGSKTFVTQSGKDFSVGSYVLATSDANPANYMLGQVTAYGGTSLTISVAATSIGGSGTYADWTLRASSPAGPQGVAGAGYTASSTTSLTVGTGSKAFTTQAGLAYTVGARVRASSAANGANYMEGLVTGYSGTTLTVNVTRTGGSGTLADWNVNLAGDPGTGDVVGPGSATDNAVARYDTATGKLIQNSSFLVDDSGHISSFGGNIKFPSAQAASADANTLDDYEEGTWTPTLTFATPGNLSVTYAASAGRDGLYTKIGRVVVVHFSIFTSAFTHTTAAGNLTITGLPFAGIEVGAGVGQRGAGLDWGGITKTNYTDIICVLNANASDCVFLASGSGQTVSAVTAADVPSGGAPRLRGSVTYFT